ncbi:MAG: TRAP transporter large permease, partial [Alphaproteobacteria bacterium]
VALLALVFLGLPVAFAMALVGFAGMATIVGYDAAATHVALIVTETVMNYTFSVAALFILMANLVSRARLSEELYAAAYAFVGHWRGGLAMATILACGGFSAVSGSSIATAATMAPIAMPQMRARGYADSLAAGSIAAGGTLGILIPPSIALVIYGNLTETDIGKLFVAGILPGILGIALYIVAIAAVTAIRPDDGPRGERVAWRQRLVVLRGVWGILTLFALVMGGIYLGVFTPTEAAGIGAAGALLFAVVRRALTVASLIEVLQETAQTTAALLIMIVGAVLLSTFMNLAGLPDAMAAFVGGLDIAPIGVMFVIVVFYVVLGCVFDAFAMILLTVPILAPLVVSLGYDLIWFGIIVVVVAEIALITPPIGINVFVLKAILQDITDTTIFVGVVPFVLVDIIRVVLLLLTPGFVLYLPSFMD